MNVVIIGKICSGKTTVADYLVAEHGFKKIALADPIKAIERELHEGVPFSDVYMNNIGNYITMHAIDQAMIYQIFTEVLQIPREEPKPRKRLQFIGTEGFRKRLDDTFWITLAQLKTQQELDTQWVIDDCRFKNEYAYFKRHLWTPIKIRVDEDVRLKRIAGNYGEYTEGQLSHASEAEIDFLLDLGDTPVIDGGKSKTEMISNVLNILKI